MKNNDRLFFLGRGSSFNTTEGNTSAYYKDKENRFMLLVDCGESVFSKIKENNILKGIDEIVILITHLHPDHVGSLGTLIYYCNYILNIKPTIINGRKIERDIFSEQLESFLKLQGIDNSLYNHIETEYLVKDNRKIKINSIEISHYPKMVSRSFKIWLNYGKQEEYIYYSGDTNCCDSILENVKNKNCVKLYVDTCLAEYEGNVHLSLSKLCRKIKNKEDRKKINCMHIDTNELIAIAKAEGFKVVELKKAFYKSFEVDYQ